MRSFSAEKMAQRETGRGGKELSRKRCMDYFEIVYIVSGFGAKAWLALTIAGGIFLALHILQGIGLLSMARRANIRGGEVMAFVPFLNSYLIGRLAGDCSVFGKKLRRGGVIFAVVEFVCCVGTALSVTAQYVLEPYLQPIGNMLFDYVNVPETLAWAETLDTVMTYVQPVLQLVYLFFLIVVLFAFFRKYAARYALLFAFCSAIVPVRSAFIFAVRKNIPVDYDSYMRARREEYYRQQRQYYGRQNPGDPYNPYNRPPYNGGNSGAGMPPQEDPFREFSQDGEKTSDKNSDESPDARSENDDFFGK